MTGSSHPIDETLVRTLAALLDETRLTEIEYAQGELRVRVARQAAVAGFLPPAGHIAPTPAAPAQASVEEELGSHPGAVKSPMVGTAYLAGQPGAAPFVRVGDTVSAGQPLLIIEAMKVMNQIPAPRGGKVVRILVGDSSPVEFDQVLMIVE